MAITSDWHIHTEHSCDSACIKYEDLVSQLKDLGITDFGVSDHYHTRIQEPDIANSRQAFDKTLENHPELKGHMHFGMEATLVSEWEVDRIARGDYEDLPVYGFRRGGPEGSPVLYDFDEEFLKKYGIEYVVAGVHWPMYTETDTLSLLKEYHRQYIYAITHPFTDIVAHWLWVDDWLLSRGGKIPFENPFINFSVVPESVKNEIKSALLQTGVALEVNSWFVLKNYPESFCEGYLGWIGDIQRAGVKISFGSDLHGAIMKERCNYAEIDKLLKKYGVDSSKFFCL